MDRQFQPQPTTSHDDDHQLVLMEQQQPLFERFPPPSSTTGGHRHWRSGFFRFFNRWTGSLGDHDIMLPAGRSSGYDHMMGDDEDGSQSSDDAESVDLVEQLQQISSPATAPPPISISTRGTTRKLGTVEGVFIPSWISIWGILVFVRLPYVIGQAGLWSTVAMFTLGFALALVTTLSISAIGSNGTVRGGGPYYLTSRTLGVEFGGSVALIMAADSVLSNAMNVFGFIEPLMADFSGASGRHGDYLPAGSGWQFLYGSVVLAVGAGMCLFGARVYARTSTAVFVVVVTCSCCLAFSFLIRRPFDTAAGVHYTGWSGETLSGNLYSNYTTTSTGVGVESFSSIFGIVYPACTGILTGASMSGDLKSPSVSIPNGTLLALAITYCSYLLLSLFFAATISRQSLVSTLTVLNDIAVPPSVIQLATYSSAMFSIVGGILTTAKVLQAMTRDNIIPPISFLARGSGSNDEPFHAILLVWFCSQLLLLVGDLNAIVPFITILTLLTYGIINFACFLLKIASAPNFRPTFVYFDWWTALCGFVGCFVCMFVVSGVDSAVAIVFMIVLLVSIHFIAPPKAWGDLQQALIYHQVRKYLLRLDMRKYHVKYWRPQILLLTRSVLAPIPLIEFANSMKKGSLYVLGDVIIGDDFKMSLDLRLVRQKELQGVVDRLNIKAFVETLISETYRSGARALMMSCGLGGMKPNIVLMPFLETERGDGADYIGIISDAIDLGHSVAIARGFQSLNVSIHSRFVSGWRGWGTRLFRSADAFDNKPYIDLYPLLMADNYSTYTMILQLGCILHMVPRWSLHFFSLRVISIVEFDEGIMWETRRMRLLLKDLRIKAKILVVSLESIGLTSKDMSPTLDGVPLFGLPKKRYSSRRTSVVSPIATPPISLQEPRFDFLDVLAQAKILNRVFRTYSHPHRTSVIFTCLADPKISSMGNYLEFMGELSRGAGSIEDDLAAGLPPTLMIYGQGVVVTKNL
eukprot:Partr_v1_DN27987_c0_g1_i1_m11631 putative solute carrier family 12 (potassium chloride transporters), member 9